MRVTLPVVGGGVVEGSAVPAHRVREAGLEQVVVAGGEFLQHPGEIRPLGGAGMREAGQVGARHQQGLEGPDGPPGHYGQPVFAIDHDPLALLPFAFGVVEQQVAAMAFQIAALADIGLRRIVRQKVTGPDLAVWVRVGTTHGRALVLEDLHPAPAGAQFVVLGDPGVDDAADGCLGQLGQCLAVVGREADDPAGAAHAVAGKEGIVPMVGRRVGQQGREVVGEDVGAGVGRVGLATHTGVAGAQVAVRVVCRARGVVGGFLLALPGAFGPVGGDEDPAVLQRVVAAMGVIGKVEHGQHPVPNGFTTRPMVRLCIAAGGAHDEQS